jgi:hypothetical protein
MIRVVILRMNIREITHFSMVVTGARDESRRHHIGLRVKLFSMTSKSLVEVSKIDSRYIMWRNLRSFGRELERRQQRIQRQ